MQNNIGTTRECAARAARDEMVFIYHITAEMNCYNSWSRSCSGSHGPFELLCMSVRRWVFASLCADGLMDCGPDNCLPWESSGV